jgi:hypothetical protein
LFFFLQQPNRWNFWRKKGAANTRRKFSAALHPKKTAATIDYPAAKKPPQILISDCFLLAFPTAFGRRKC